MLIAVVKAANTLKAARIIVEVLIDLLSANTSCDINFAVASAPIVLLVAGWLKEGAVWFPPIVSLNVLSAALANKNRAEAAIILPISDFPSAVDISVDRRQRAVALPFVVLLSHEARMCGFWWWRSEVLEKRKIQYEGK
jgi:hypothetical protein